MNRADLFAIVAGCRAGEKRVIELCERFGKETYLAALQALLDRTYEAMRTLIRSRSPRSRRRSRTTIDDDGLGNGPYKMKLTIWREGDHAFFDWSGTDPQALGPINFYLSEGMFKMFIGIYLIMVNDPQILFNDGFYPLLHVVMPEGRLLRPRFPAALGCRTHALARLFDVLGGALCKHAPELNTAAGYGTSPYMLYSGWDGEAASSSTRWRSSTAASRAGRSATAWTATRGGRSSRTSRPSTSRPTTRCGSTATRPSPTPAAPGFHRGGNGVEKRYVYLEPGEVSIHDDRWLTRPWGVLGGQPGGRSEKLLRRADGTEELLPSKCDNVVVEPGDMLVYRTAGGGGWKDRLDRPVGGGRARRLVRARLARERAGRATASSSPTTARVDEAATEAERDAPARGARRRARVRLRPVARGGARELQGRDRARAADAGDAAALVAARAGRRGARARARRATAVPAADERAMKHAGFHGRAGFGRRPALLVVDVNLGFTDPASPLVCDLDDVVAAIARLLDAFRARGLPGRLHDRRLRRGATRQAAAVVHRQDPGAARRSRPGSALGRDRPADRAARRTSRC